MLRDGGVHHAAVAEFLQQALADFIGALILGDFFAHQKDQRIAPHFFRHGIAQGIAHRGAHHLGAFRQGRIAGNLEFGLLRHGGWSGFCWLRDFSFGRFDFCCLGCRRFSRSVFAIGQKRGDGRIDLHPFAAFGHQEFSDAAFIHRFEFHGGLVGLDLGQDGTGLDDIAFLHQPAGELALFHGGRQCGHQDLRGHQITISV